jgi:hypothetical protein
MQKELRMSFSEYQELFKENEELKSEVKRIHKLLKEEGRVIDLRIHGIRKLSAPYAGFNSLNYPVYEHANLTDAEKVVNELVGNMRKAVDDLLRKLIESEQSTKRAENYIDAQRGEIDYLKSRNWFKRLFNL